MKKDQGYSAYPHDKSKHLYSGEDGYFEEASGMPIRSWYAGHALAAITTPKVGDFQFGNDSLVIAERAAKLAFEIADAMIREDKKGRGIYE